MTKAFVTKGKWRGQSVKNVEFELVSPEIMRGKMGLYITVDGAPLKSNTKNIRIYIDNEHDVNITGKKVAVIDDESDSPVVETPLDGEWNNETEQQAIDRINSRFEILKELTEACIFGHIRGMIVSGAPGVGKTFTVEETLFDSLAWKRMDRETEPYEIVHGNVSPIGLYKKLFEFRHPENILVFDDSDSVFFEPVSLGLLKTALDTSSKRVLSWNSESRVLKDENIDNRFQFEGAVIFVTNMDLEATKSKILKPHFDALISRSHYLDLTIKSRRDKFLRIKGLVETGDIFEKYNFDEQTKADILEFIKTNVNELRELSLRTAVKIADIVKIRPKNWRDLCRITVCK